MVKSGEEIPALGHTYKETTKIEPTCTEIGYQYYVCETCGIEKAEELAKTEHDYDIDYSNDATCTKDGTIKYTCKNCGDTVSYKVPAKGHTESEAVMENIVDPTCTTDGSYDSVVYCSVCGEELSRENVVVEATGHTTELENAKDATCVEKGYTGDEVCTVCGEVLVAGEEIPALGHKWELDPSKSVAATAESEGKEVYYCPVCGETYEKVLPKITHESHNYVVTERKAETCDKDGYIIYTCQDCDKTYTETIKATGHKESVEWVVTVEPTCTEKGVKVKYCTVCNEILETEEISALGHKASLAVVENNVAPTCTKDGSYDSVVYCSVCGEELSRENVVVKATGHQKTELVNAKDATCTEDGYTGDEVCTVCGEVLVAGKAIPALGHTTELVNAKDATYFAKGYTGDKVCSVCGEVIEKGKAIAKLKLTTPKITLKSGKKLFKVTYKKVTGATGFQVRYKLNGKWTVKTFNSKKTATKTIKKLKKGKKYTVQIRAYVKSGKNTAYSSWTKTKNVKVK